MSASPPSRSRRPSAARPAADREERRQRSPPGLWRLLAPALLGWACTAAAVARPGAARWMALAAAILGLATLLFAAATRHRRPPRPEATAGSDPSPAARRGRDPAVRAAARAVAPGERPAPGPALVRWVAVACAVLVLLGARIDALERVRDDPGLAAAARGESVELEVVLRDFPETAAAAEPGRAAGRAAAWAEGARGAVPLLLWLDEAPDPEWGPGTRLSVSGTLTRLAPGSEAAYGLGVRGAAGADPGGPATRVAARLRAGLRGAATAVPGAELVPGFAVGDTALVGAELERRMRASSLTHLVAVSGANCALVTSAVAAVAARLGAGRRARAALSGAALLALVSVVGPDPSVQRAAVMAGVLLVSGYGGRRAAALPSLGVAILALLGADPWQALRPGFALSVAATAGILLLAPPLDAALARRLRVPSWLRLPVVVAVSAQLACGPLLLLLDPGIPAAAVPANVLAAPAAPLGTGLGLLALVLLPWAPAAGSLLVRAAAVPAQWIAATAEVTSALPHARLAWPGGWPGALLLAAVEGALLLAWRIAAVGGTRAPWTPAWERSRAARAVVALLACGGLGTAVGVAVVSPLVTRAGIPAAWSVVACDVGQGDAILLRDPDRRGSTMLVDTGDAPEALRACLDRFGVGRIELLVLTHDDRDHVGALDEVAPRVGSVLVAPDTAEDASGRPLLARLRRAGLSPRLAGAGAAGGGPGLAWEVLAPDPARPAADGNAGSLVMRVRAGGLTVLLLGDTGREEHAALLRAGADVRADVVKVAHHGSRDQEPALLAAAGARYGLVSVGADNRYGHPSGETLSALSEAGTVALRTDLLGSVAVAATGAGPEVWVERGGPRGGSPVGGPE